MGDQELQTGATPVKRSGYDAAVLAVNAVYVPKGGSATDLRRVLHVDPVARQAALIVLDGSSFPFWQSLSELQAELAAGLLLRVEYPNDAALAVPEEHLSDSAKATRERRWAVIQEIVCDPERPDLNLRTRGQVVQDAKRKHHVTADLIYGALRLYWTGGQTPNALVGRQHRCGAKGKPRRPAKTKRGRPNALVTIGAGDAQAGINITEELKELLRDGAKKFYWTRDKLSVREAHRRTLLLHFQTVPQYEPDTKTITYLLPPPEELPTEEQFYEYGVNQLWKEDHEWALQRRNGRRTFNQQNRAATKGRRPSFGPGDIAELDWTQVSVDLVSRRYPDVDIGQAVVYAVRERFAGLVTGFAAGPESASYKLCSLALENALTEKVEFCARYDIKIRPEEWPFALFRRLICDRGPVELGKHLRSAIGALGAKFGEGTSISNLPPHRPDWKPGIERLFGHAKALIRHLPGARPGVTDLGTAYSDAPVTRPRLNIDDLNRILILYFCWFNNHYATPLYVPHEGVLQDHVPSYAVDRWKWGIEHLRGAPVEIDRNRVRRALLVREDNLRPTELGVRMNGLLYVAFEAGADTPAEALQRYVGPSLRATGREAPLVTGYRDPGNSSFGWVGPAKLTPDTLELQLLRLRPAVALRHGGCTDYELKQIRETERASKIQLERESIGHETTLLAQIGSIVRDSEIRAKAWSARQQEAEDVHHERAWAAEPPSDAEKIAFQWPVDTGEYLPRPPRLDLTDPPRPEAELPDP